MANQKTEEYEPVLDLVDDVSFDEDGTATISLSASDVEEDVLTYSASLDGNGSASIDGETLTVTPNANFNGDIIVSIQVSDDDLTDDTSFTLTVVPVNETGKSVDNVLACAFLFSRVIESV